MAARKRKLAFRQERIARPLEYEDYFVIAQNSLDRELISRIASFKSKYLMKLLMLTRKTTNQCAGFSSTKL